VICVFVIVIMDRIESFSNHFLCLWVLLVSFFKFYTFIFVCLQICIDNIHMEEV